MPNIEIWKKEITIKEVKEIAVSEDVPSGYYKVKKIYVDPNTGRLQVEYENTPE